MALSRFLSSVKVRAARARAVYFALPKPVPSNIYRLPVRPAKLVPVFNVMMEAA
jgi:hypothetical protein